MCWSAPLASDAEIYLLRPPRLDLGVRGRSFLQCGATRSREVRFLRGVDMSSRPIPRPVAPGGFFLGYPAGDMGAPGLPLGPGTRGEGSGEEREGERGRQALAAAKEGNGGGLGRSTQGW